MIASLRLSAQVSIQFIKDSDPESMDLFLLLGMLPGGVSPSDLDYLWRKVTDVVKLHDESKNGSKRTGKYRSKESFELNVSPDTTLGEHVSPEHPWRRAFNELQKGQLVEEKQVAQRRNTKEEEGQS